VDRSTVTQTDPWLAIQPDEFRARQNRAREAAQEAELDGLLVYSRGGAFMDMSADVLYLTNHYSNQPYVADHVGLGNARSHGVVVLPVDGPTVLINDVPWGRRDLTVADDVRYSIHVTDRVGEALRDTGLVDQRVGLVGTSYMTAAAYLGLMQVGGDTTFVRTDDLVERLRIVKSPAEQGLIRRACDIGNRAVEAMMDAAVEGATEGDAVAAAATVVAASGAVLYDCLCSSGPHAHYVAYGRLPSHDVTRSLEAGELFSVDCFGAYGGYFWDFARTRVVGDQATGAQRDLAEAVIDGVERICAAIRPGATGHDLFRIGDEWLVNDPVVNSLPHEEEESEGFPAVGHGLGLSWEAPWLMEGDPTPIEPGMYLAVELFAGHESVGGAMFEQNGLVTDDGFEVLTTARKRWW
jgi:Xaa-Pro aminopeptidase